MPFFRNLFSRDIEAPKRGAPESSEIIVLLDMASGANAPGFISLCMSRLKPQPTKIL
jgi:hypothetical protein